MEKNISFIGEELFNKIRGRFPKVALGDEKGLVTNDPKEARFFDFEFTEGGAKGSINIAVDKESLNIMYANSFLEDVGASTKKSWYGFLKELRQFAKKRLLNFDVRNISKSNLDRRDYEFITKQKFGESQMTESRLYGTTKQSFQDIGSARMNIIHSRPVSSDNPAGRTTNIGSIYIENNSGERFKYPMLHINGARAMTRHIAEGGNPYDDFGKHILGLSEELNQLRKFKLYMGRSNVVAEGMADYLGIVVERIQNIKKTVNRIQRESTYKKLRDNHIHEELTEMPEDLAQNWIDQLTVKQFNEELKDVFPYIYKLVSETDRVQSLGVNDILGEDDDEDEETVAESPFDEFEAWANDKVNSAVQTEAGKPDFIDADGDGDKEEPMKKAFKDKKKKKDEGMKSVRGNKRHKMKRINPIKDSEENSKIPVTEFVLSMYDKETGQFPKGETAVLTAVEKDYGQQTVEVANKFIKAINERFAQYHTRNRPEFIEDNGDAQLDDIVRLSGMG